MFSYFNCKQDILQKKPQINEILTLEFEDCSTDLLHIYVGINLLVILSNFVMDC